MRITRNWGRGCWLRRYSIEVCVSNVGPCQEIGRVVLPTCKYRAAGQSFAVKGVVFKKRATGGTYVCRAVILL